jgi:hypothetical protein
LAVEVGAVADGCWGVRLERLFTVVGCRLLIVAVKVGSVYVSAIEDRAIEVGASDVSRLCGGVVVGVVFVCGVVVGVVFVCGVVLCVVVVCGAIVCGVAIGGVVVGEVVAAEW